MIGQILPNNNKRCYGNFLPTFREVNVPLSSLPPTWTHLILSLLHGRNRQMQGQHGRRSSMVARTGELGRRTGMRGELDKPHD
jgi:hypothetical protein